MKRLFLKNASSGVAHIAVNALLLLVMIPLMIRSLGSEAYGIYALLTAVSSFGALTNFGLTTSLLKHLAGSQDRQTANDDIVVTFVILASVTVVTASIAIVFKDMMLSGLLSLRAEIVTPEVRHFYLACVLGAVLQVIAQVPAAVLDAQEKVYVTNGLQLLTTVFKHGGTLVILVFHPQLATIGWNLLATSFLSAVALTWIAWRSWGGIDVPGLGERFGAVAAKHFRYGRSIYAGSVMFFLYDPLTRILISRYIGLNEVGFFDVAVRIKGLVWSFLERILYPFLPMIAGRSASKEVKHLVGDIQQKVLLCVIPLLVGTFFLGPPLINLWLRNPSPMVVTSVVSVVSCYLIAILFVPVYQFLTVQGHPEKTFVLQLVNMSVNIAGFALLVPWFGYLGAITAFCIAVLSSSGLSVWYQWSLLGSTIMHGNARSLRLAIFALSLVVVIGIPVLFFHPAGWLEMAALAVFHVVVTLFLFRMLKLISRHDIERLIGTDNSFGPWVERLLIGDF